MIEVATLEHVRQVAPRLRQGDVREILLASGHGPDSSLTLSVALSFESYAYCENGRAEILFGVAPHPEDSDVGVPWLLATDILDKRGLTLVRHTRPFVLRWLRFYGRLENHTSTANTVAIRWLKRSGFKLREVVPEYGTFASPFIRFELENPHV